MEEWVETMSSVVQLHEVENMLWAFATMGRKHGERVMGQEEDQVKAIHAEFNSQSIKQALWAYAKKESQPGSRLQI